MRKIKANCDAKNERILLFTNFHAKLFKYMIKLVSTLVLILLFVAQLPAQVSTQKERLQQYGVYLRKVEDDQKKQALLLAQKKGWPTERILPNGDRMLLVGVNAGGTPEYLTTYSNVGAAATTGASQLWPGGALNLNLTGSSSFMAGRLAIWDGGLVRGTHIEMAGRVVPGDGSGLSDHGSHVAGTMMATGINATARGMAYGAPNITSYDFSNDNSEMATAAGNFLVSNHSYGSIAGWFFRNGIWEFWGDWNAREDFRFGFYSAATAYWDSLAFLAPNYLIIKSAGNNRNNNGPAVGANYRRYDQSGQMADAGPYVDTLSRNNGYDILPTNSNAKNIITVGAVGILANGYQGPSSVLMSTFSSWGPTDDGRIKPDIVGAGVGLLSISSSADNAYATSSGTSMSAPNVSGSLFLLQELYRRETGAFMRSATLRGIAIHTADEAGSAPGPDYRFGWGLLNVARGAQVITGRNQTHAIQERVLNQGQSFSTNVVASGTGPLAVTICWTDPPAPVDEVNRLNNPTPKLINDLDVRVISASGTEQPWILDRLNPDNAATRGDNVLDNVEKIEILNPIPGQVYEVRVTHKGTLRNGTQAYSLIMSGVGGTAYCASAPASPNDTRIDNFTFAGINRNGTGVCTQYTNATNIFGTVSPGASLPFSVSLGTCGGNVNKIARIFVDWNRDGDFDDAGELAATSAVISGSSVFSGNINVPGVQPGTSTRLRVVVSETTNVAGVTSCGTLPGGGETQDYSLNIVRAALDAQPLQVRVPDQTNPICAGPMQFTVRVSNEGTSSLTNIPVVAVVREGATIVATLNDTIRTAVAPGTQVTHYMQQLFTTLPSRTYQVQLYTNNAVEENRFNDTITGSNFSTAAASTATITPGSGQICSPTSARATATVSGFGNNLFWYTQAVGGAPVARGSSLNTTVVPTNRTYFLGVNDARTNVGPVTKNVLGLSGDYGQFAPSINVSALTPVVIERARMYFGAAGRITFVVRDAGTNDVIAQTVVEVTPTRTSPGTTNDLADTGRIVPLNLRLPSGQYTITPQFENGATIFRNNFISANPYPMTVNQLFSITGNTAGEGFYYYFYDMEVRSLSCGSASRIPFVLDAMLQPNITQVGNVLNSGVSTGSIQWFLNNTAIPGATNPTLTITQGGVFRVDVTKDGCLFSSAEFSTWPTSVTNLNPSSIGMVVTPNPTPGAAEVRFALPKREIVTLQVLDASGRVISQEQFTALPGSLISRPLALQNAAPGMYLVKLYFDNKQFIQRLTLAR